MRFNHYFDGDLMVIHIDYCNDGGYINPLVNVYVQFAIERGHRNDVSFPMKTWS